MKTFAAALLLGFFTLSQSALAQTTPTPGQIGGKTLDVYLPSIVGFISSILVPLLFAVAFIVFIYGVFQYFIAGGANEEQREKGKQLVMWGIIAFVVMVSLWGLVNLIRNTLNFGENGNTPPLPTFKVTPPAS